MNLLSIQVIALLLAATALAGCGQEADKQGPQTQSKEAGASLPAQAADQAAIAANAGSVTPRYQATLGEGIDFAKPGAPDFVVAISGLSGVEGWGRWTDANLGAVVLRFRDPLPQRFTLKLKVRDYFGLNANQSIVVRAGEQEQSFVLEGGESQIVELPFDGVNGADALELVIPTTSNPNGNDTRRIGLGLISLSIQE